MVRIRLRRVGLKRQPSYRLVVTDKRKARDGGFIEIIGNHNPRTRPETNAVKEDRALYWLSVGAQPSNAVRRIFQQTGTWDRYQRLRQGEDIDTLVAEAAEAAANAEPTSGKTEFPAPAAGESKIKAREAALADAEAEAEG